MENQVIIPEIETVASKEQIAPDGIVALQSNFSPHFQAFAALYPEAREVQDDEPKKARTLRLKVRAIRIASDATRKDMKADSLRRSRAIDGVHNILMASLEPVEEHLDKIEKAEELREKARKDALVAERSDKLKPYFENVACFNLGEMPESQFIELLAGGKAAHEAKHEAERKAKAEMQAKIDAELAERARIREENARLAKIAAEEKAAREEAERKAAAERAEAARLAKIESDKRDAAERARREKERKERAEADAKAQAALAKERAERERIQAEIDTKANAERERIEAEKAESRRAAAAPDREKLETLALAIDAIAIPQLSDEKMRDTVSDQLGKLASWLRRTAQVIGA